MTLTPPPDSRRGLTPVQWLICVIAAIGFAFDIYELLMLSDKVRRLCLDKADAGSIRNAAMEEGMVTLRFDGARKVVLGMTTPEEVMLMTAESGD